MMLTKHFIDVCFFSGAKLLSKKCKMVSVFTQLDVNTWEVGRTQDKLRKPRREAFTSGYVNTVTILHFCYKITNERGTKTMFTYAHVKWFYGQSEHAYYLNYFIICIVCYNPLGLFARFRMGITWLKCSLKAEKYHLSEISKILQSNSPKMKPQANQVRTVCF